MLIISFRLHFRPRTPPQESSNMLLSSESVDNVEYDSEGNVIPVVAINSFKEYLDENNLDIFSLSNGSNEIDLASFESHQKELFEMQRKQMERLKNNSDSETDTNSVSNKTGYNVCNSEHSSKIISCAPSISWTSANTSSKSSPSLSSSTSSSTLQFSTLDSASVQFAVSVVRSASEVTTNRNTNYNININNDNISAKDNIMNNMSSNCESYVTAITSTNGPIHENEFVRKTNSEISEPSTTPSDAQQDTHNQNTNANTTLSSLTTTPTSCKVKYQNRSQNTSLPPTDVT